jgi:hypothetical protein
MNEGVIVAPPFADLDRAAFYGLVGDFASTIEPFSEACNASIIVQYLTMFGCAAGRSAYRMVGRTRHHTNVFCVVVGPTSASRKGSSTDWVKDQSTFADPSFQIRGGLASGEGLLHHVRDARIDDVRDKRTGELRPGKVDLGVDDKRLMVFESELSKVLSVCEREGTTLSEAIRQAWDSGALGSLGKQSKDRATGAHIAIIAQITPLELSERLLPLNMVNGFANRFLWVFAWRTKFLANPGEPSFRKMNDLAQRLRQALTFARTVKEMSYSPEVLAFNEAIYPRLDVSRPGLLGALLGRAAPQVLRLALNYALLHLSSQVEVAHYCAVLAVWEYCERSARYLFNSTTGNPNADKIIATLLANRERGLTRTQISDLFRRNANTADIETALELLRKEGLAGFEKVPTGGAPVERWRATGKEVASSESYLSLLRSFKPSPRALRRLAAAEERSLKQRARNEALREKQGWRPMES